MSVLSTLVRMKFYLQDYGWQQHHAGYRGRPACLAGACIFSSSGDWDESDTIKALRQALRTTNICVWNDRRKRTKEQVLEAIDKTIDFHVRSKSA